MRIALGNDHRGVALKRSVADSLRAQGHLVEDMGSQSEESCDYPDFAAAVAEKVARGQADRGVLICASGVGMSIAANKLPGVRAATITDERTAEMSRRHNDLNVLCLAADAVDAGQAARLVELFVSTPFEGGRHARRLEKIAALECQPENTAS